MTDREAIRRLAEIVERMCLNIPIVGDNPRAILDDLAEPAAPTVTRKFVEVPRDTPCGACGQVVEPGSGAHDCPTPTVTWEQARAIENALLTFLYHHGANWGLHDLPTEAESPAFFRAVADALEKK